MCLHHHIHWHNSCALHPLFILCCSWMHCVCDHPPHFSHPCTPSPLLLHSNIIHLAIFFCPNLMFTIFLNSLGHVLNLSAKFCHFWNCFGWVQKWCKFEFNSNLNYFSASKNVQTNLFKYYINWRSQGYFYISLTLPQIPSAFLLLFLVEEIEEK